jgi:hypothetical protein
VPLSGRKSTTASSERRRKVSKGALPIALHRSAGERSSMSSTTFTV